MLTQILRIVKQKIFYYKHDANAETGNFCNGLIIQSGVIPYILCDTAQYTILIKNRSGKKWIFPKGSIEKGMTPAYSAAKEAMEEAGLKGVVSHSTAGYYEYKKNNQCYRVYLYPMRVDRVEEEWPESAWRTRIIINTEILKSYIDDESICIIAERFLETLSS